MYAEKTEYMTKNKAGGFASWLWSLLLTRAVSGMG
jgi:hypothetical protein